VVVTGCPVAFTLVEVYDVGVAKLLRHRVLPQRILPISRMIGLQYRTGITYTSNKCVEVRNQRKLYIEIKSMHVKFRSCRIHANDAYTINIQLYSRSFCE